MSFSDITKPNKQNRLDGYFRNLKANNLSLDLSCNVPEISIEQLKLTNPITENKTTLKTVAEEDYDVIFPANQALENSLITINQNGELNFLPSSTLPTIGGNIVCDSLTSGTFVNSATMEAGQITSLNQVETTNLRLNGILGGQTRLLCQDTDSSTGDSIKFPNTANPQEPEEGMVLKVKTATAGAQGYAVDTVWGYQNDEIPLFATSGTTISYSSSNGDKGVEKDFLQIPLPDFTSYYRVDIDIQWKKLSGGTNSYGFTTYITSVLGNTFKYAGRTHSDLITNPSNLSINDTVDQTFSLDFLNGGDPLDDTNLILKFITPTGSNQWNDWNGTYKVKLYKVQTYPAGQYTNLSTIPP